MSGQPLHITTSLPDVRPVGVVHVEVGLDDAAILNSKEDRTLAIDESREPSQFETPEPLSLACSRLRHASSMIQNMRSSVNTQATVGRPRSLGPDEIRVATRRAEGGTFALFIGDARHHGRDALLGEETRGRSLEEIAPEAEAA
jgi:hypothetical protein